MGIRLSAVLFFLAFSALAQPRPSMESDRSVIDLGRVTAGCPGCGIASMTLTLRTVTPWQLVARSTSTSGEEASDMSSGEGFRIRRPNSLWQDVRRETPLDVATGTTAGTFTLVLEVGVTCPFDAALGPRDTDLELTLLPEGISQRIDVRFTVAPVFEVEMIEKVDVPGVNAAAIGLQHFQTQKFLVKSNTQWQLDVALQKPLRGNGSSVSLDDDRLYARGEGLAKPVGLKVGVPTTIATGPPTGPGGTSVELRLYVSTDRLIVADIYVGALDLLVGPRVRQGGAVEH